MAANGRARERGILILRLVLGFEFLYAGLEKLLNFAGDELGWSAAGFLRFATTGTVPNMVGHPEDMVHNPTRQLWVDLANNTTAIDMVNALSSSASSRSASRSSLASPPGSRASLAR